jgi:hypothetical protein
VNAQSIIVSISSVVDGLMQYVHVSLLINGTQKRELMKINFFTNITKVFTSTFSSVADPGCLSRIPDPDFYPSQIPYPGSKNGNKRDG